MYNNMNVLTRVCAAVCALSVLTLTAQEQPKAKAKAKSWKETKNAVLQDDFPYTKACIGAKFPANNDADKGIALILGNEAFACFDMDLLRVSALWTGGYITPVGVTFNGAHGGHPSIAGEQQLGTPALPGWSTDGAFKDPRPEPYGPLPKEMGRYKGLYVVGMDVVLTYDVFGSDVVEQITSVEKDGATGFVRTLKLDKTKAALVHLVAEVPEGKGRIENGEAIVEGANGVVTRIALGGAPKGATLEIANNNRVVLKLAKGTAGLFKLVLWRGNAADGAKFAGLVAGKPQIVDYAKGGAARWPEVVTTKGALGTSATPDGAYTTDSLTPPFENPWKRRVRFGGFDFFKDGKSAALSTWDGDVWVVTGIDDKLENLQWRRFASGGFETLGLEIVNDVIYTMGRDEMTRYVDVNKDGEADYYESFNNDITSSPGFHEFTFDLQTDKQGNFYFAKAAPVRGGGRGFGGGGGNGEISASAGTLMKVSKDGKKYEVVATGFRAPNGIGVGPNGELTTGDNEGTFVAACPVNWVKPGGFYGVEDTAHKSPLPQRDPPLCWLSHREFDNSGGGQVWVTSEKWGPFTGELLHMSYGKSSLNLVMRDMTGKTPQGAVIQLPLRFTSSAMRARFSPLDGQLYVAGLRGWQTSAAKDAGLDRVRYTGKPVYSVAATKVDKAGVHLTFTQPLDPKDATDPQNYSIQQWNYLMKFGSDKVVNGKITRSEAKEANYGGHEVSRDDEFKPGRENVDVKSAKLSADGKTVTLEFADLKPVQQMLIKFNLGTKDGQFIKQDILQTINEVK